MDKYKKSKFIGVSASAVSAVLSAGALAQTTPLIEEILVTASKRATSLQDTPIAVHVTSSETIDQAKIFDLYDLATVVPTLRVNTSTRSSGQSFSIRGFGSSTSLGTEPSVGVFVDGVFRSRSTGAIADLPRLERVEVLSGPQSTLFGKNASAGVISLVTAEPSFTPSGKLEATYGNYNQQQVKGYWTGGLTDQIAASFSGGINQRDGYTDAVNPDAPGVPDIDDRNRWNARAQLLWEPTANSKFRFIADYSDIDEVCCATPNLVQGPTQGAIIALGGVILGDDPFARESVVRDEPRSEVSDGGVSLHADFSFDAFDVTSITAYRSNEISNAGHVGSTSINIATASDINKTEIDAFSQELRLTSTGDGPLNWILGGFYFNEQIDSQGGIVYGDALGPYVNILVGGALSGLEAALGFPAGTFFADGTVETTATGQDNEDYSVFGTVDYQFNESWSGTVGLNYTRDQKEAYLTEIENGDVFSSLGFLASGPLGGLQFRPPIVGFPNVLEDGESDDDETTYLVRLAWEMNENVNFYVSTATGFKSSAWDLSNFSRPSASLADALDAAGINSSNPKYGSRLSTPEYSTVYELGAKLYFDNFALNIAIFDQSLEDFQVRSFDGVDFFQANAGETSVDGIEFDLRYSPTPSWTFTLAGTFLDPVFDEFTNAPPGPNSPRDENGNRVPDDLSGETPLNIPEESISAGVLYNHTFGNGMSMYARADYQYESAVQVDRNNPEFERKINNLNMSAALQFNENLSLQVWGRNVTDDENIQSVFGGAAQPGTISAFINPPRTYGLTLAYEFN